MTYPRKGRGNRKGGSEIEDWGTTVHLSLNSSDLPSYGSESRIKYTLRLFLMYPEKGRVLEVTLSGRRQMTYIGEERVCLGDRGKFYRLIIKWTSFKNLFNNFPNILRSHSIDCFWKSLYCIAQKMHISAYLCKTFLIESAIFLKCRQTFEVLL